MGHRYYLYFLPAFRHMGTAVRREARRWRASNRIGRVAAKLFSPREGRPEAESVRALARPRSGNAQAVRKVSHTRE